MSGRLQLRHLSAGPWSGRVLDLSGVRLRLGRHPDNDVVFDAEGHGMVSGHHAELRVDGPRLTIVDLGSRNGTYVDGVRIDAEKVLAGDERVRLGGDGPEFVVDFATAVGSQTATTFAAKGTAAVAPQSARRGGRKWVAGVVLALGVGAAWWSLRTPPGAGGGAPDAAAPQGAVGQATAAAAPGDAVAGTAPTPGPAAAANSGPATPVDWPAVLSRVAPSVYLVVRAGTVQGEHIEQAFGTAWVVGPGVLATNAHIAAAHAAGKPSLLVRSSAVAPKDFPVVDVQIHPAFEPCRRLLAAYRPFDANTATFLNLEPGYDVALLRVADDRRDELEAPLPIASDAVLQRLVAGEELASIGFPKEGMQGGGTDIRSPEPTTDLKPLTRLADVLFSKVRDYEDAVSLSYAFVAVGGSSGSPVFDRDGQVVGLIASGNVTSQGNTTRNAVDGSCYGPRADLVRELLDGTAAARQPRRERRLEAALFERFKAGTDTPRLFARSLVRQVLVDGGRDVPTIERIAIGAETEVALAAAGEVRSSGPLRVPAADTYRLVVFCRDWPQRPVVRMRQGGGAWSEDFASERYWFLSAPLRLHPDRALEVEVRGAVTGPTSKPTAVTVMLLHETQ